MLIANLEASLEVSVVVVHLIKLALYGCRMADPASASEIFSSIEGRKFAVEFVGDWSKVKAQIVAQEISDLSIFMVSLERSGLEEAGRVDVHINT